MSRHTACPEGPAGAFHPAAEALLFALHSATSSPLTL